MSETYHPTHENHGPQHTSQKVVSVRMDTILINELDALATRSGRSRGFYLRAAVQEMLPVLKERYWHHDTQTRHQELDNYSRFMDELGGDAKH